jgi:ABC-type phosphonate transport system ATPase subunit
MSLITIHKTPTEEEINFFVNQVIAYFNVRPDKQTAWVRMPWGLVHQIRRDHIREDVIKRCSSGN